MANDADERWELISLRTRVELLEQDVSQTVHLLYSWLVCLAKSPTCELRHRALSTVRAKFLQLPQAFRLGQALIELDGQFGHTLKSNGVNLERWVYEPRGRHHG